VILGAGLLWYAVQGRHQIGTLASHTLSSDADSQRKPDALNPAT